MDKQQPEVRRVARTKPAETTEIEVVANEPAPVIPLHSDAGTLALALLDDEAFNERLTILKRGRDRIAQIQRELMEQDVDYGLIPGTPKPTLFKSGAEKLALIYRLAARLETTFTPGDGEKQPPLRYEASAFLHLGTFDGPVVAVGHGTANSWEKRYRRDSQKVCPKCGQTAIIKSKFEPGWYCFPKKGGCGTNFAPNDEAITQQGTDAKGDPVEANDLQNTLLKMAEKRAFVDSVLRATASSSLFTQDVAEEPVDERTLSGVSGYDESTHGPSPQVTAGGAVVNADGEVVERRETTEEKPAETRPAQASVQRGGHTEQTNTAQLAQVSTYSKALRLGPHGMADELKTLFPAMEFELAEDKPIAAEQLMKVLTEMSSEDVGKLLTHLRNMQAAADK